MLPAYVQTSVPAALWWAVTGIAQLALAIAVLRAPSRFRLAAAAEVSGTMVVICLITRFAAGAVPKNMLWEPVDTAVGFTDIADLALQLVAAVLLTLAALRWPRRRARHRALVVTVTVLLMPHVARAQYQRRGGASAASTARRAAAASVMPR